MFARCQVVYTRASTIAGDENLNYLYEELAGSWNKNNTAYYITFESYNEYIASIYIDNEYEYGFVVKSRGYYYLKHDTLFLEDDFSGVVSQYIIHTFVNNIQIEPLYNGVTNRFRGRWDTVPYISEYVLVQLPVTGPPVIFPPNEPIEPEPVVELPYEPEVPEVQKDDKHKKRTDEPVVRRPQRPENEKPVEAPKPANKVVKPGKKVLQF